MNVIGSYEEIADNYANVVDSKPIHVFYERPNLSKFFPEDCHNKTVLDLGCGTGWYAQQFIKKGAQVISVDVSSKMVDFARTRNQGQGEFICADLNQPMDFVPDNSVDFISAPLLIHYINDWRAFFKEIHRVLKPGGQMCFSTHQPHNEVAMFNLDSYFRQQVITDYWDGIGEVSFYHHTLEELFESILQAGLSIKRILEPKAIDKMKETDPMMYDNICKNPWLLFGLVQK